MDRSGLQTDAQHVFGPCRSKWGQMHLHRFVFFFNITVWYFGYRLAELLLQSDRICSHQHQRRYAYSLPLMQEVALHRHQPTTNQQLPALRPPDSAPLLVSFSIRETTPTRQHVVAGVGLAVRTRAEHIPAVTAYSPHRFSSRDWSHPPPILFYLFGARLSHLETTRRLGLVVLFFSHRRNGEMFHVVSFFLQKHDLHEQTN